MPEQRFKPLSIDEMTPDQRRIAERIASGPRGGLQGPFHPMLRSPGLADVWEPVGAYVRFRSVLPEPLKELAILVTARHWTLAVRMVGAPPPRARRGPWRSGLRRDRRGTAPGGDERGRDGDLRVRDRRCSSSTK